MHQPLKGLSVLDFTHLLPGELCSTLLADLGCQVLRVEPLSEGLAKKLPPTINGESLYYWSLHRNKRRMALDLKKAEAKGIIRMLAPRCDIVLENFRPGVMDRLGIGFLDLKEVNERLVFCSISGYGQRSSFSQRPGHDLNFLAESGILARSLDRGGYPVVPGVLVSDYLAANHAALSVVAAVFDRQRTGCGAHLDISMFRSAISSMAIDATRALYKDEPKTSYDDLPFRLPNYDVYKCADEGYLAVACLEHRFWVEFCRRLGREDLVDRYPTGPDAQLKREIEEAIKEKALEQWREIFDQAECCVSPVLSLKEALSFLPDSDRPLVWSLQHPKIGSVPQLASPMPLERDDGRASTFDVERETVLVLGELGFSGAEIDALQASGVISQPRAQAVNC